MCLSGVAESSSNSSIIFTESDGGYYSAASPILINGVEYIAAEPNSTVTVNNANVIVTVHYMPVNTITTTTLLTWVATIVLFIAIIVILMSIRPRRPRPSESTGTQVAMKVFPAFSYPRSDSSRAYICAVVY
jgi:hypothetical protein